MMGSAARTCRGAPLLLGGGGLGALVRVYVSVPVATLGPSVPSQGASVGASAGQATEEGPLIDNCELFLSFVIQSPRHSCLPPRLKQGADAADTVRPWKRERATSH